MGHNKSSFLKQPVEHIDITSFDARPIIDSMSKMSFVSRETANASKIYNNMLKDKECTIFLTLAGSTSAAGCMKLYADLVKNNMVDAIVATGASIIDMDFFEALGFKHYQGFNSKMTVFCEIIILIAYMILTSMKMSYKIATGSLVRLLIHLNQDPTLQENLSRN